MHAEKIGYRTRNAFSQLGARLAIIAMCHNSAIIFHKPYIQHFPIKRWECWGWSQNTVASTFLTFFFNIWNSSWQLKLLWRLVEPTIYAYPNIPFFLSLLPSMKCKCLTNENLLCFLGNIVASYRDFIHVILRVRATCTLSIAPNFSLEDLK